MDINGEDTTTFTFQQKTFETMVETRVSTFKDKLDFLINSSSTAGESTGNMTIEIVNLRRKVESLSVIMTENTVLKEQLFSSQVRISRLEKKVIYLEKLR